MRIIRFLALFVPFILVGSVFSQNSDNCPALVEQAIQQASQSCQNIGRNQACYGNPHLVAEPYPDVTDFTFEEPGDMAEVMNIVSMRLSPMDTMQQTWGVSLMKVQANIPDTLPGQNVTFVLFGDVEIRNAVETNVEPVTFNVISTGNINVRSGPSTNNAPIASLSDGETVVADCRNPDSSWLGVQLSDGTPGWVRADLVMTDDDITLLNVVDPHALAPSLLNPMQAFYLRTGIGDSACHQAPDSGIVIQTPEGVGEIALRINGVDIQLASTAYLDADPNSGLALFTLEGEAEVAALGISQTVTAGNRTSVALDANLDASQPPTASMAFTAQDVAGVSAPLRMLAQGDFNMYDLPNCRTSNGPLLVGQDVVLVSGNGCWATMEEAQAAFEGHTEFLSIDGVAVEAERHGASPATCGSGERFSAGLSYHWTPVAGTHTFHMTWSGPVANFEYTCTAMVFE